MLATSSAQAYEQFHANAALQIFGCTRSPEGTWRKFMRTCCFLLMVSVLLLLAPAGTSRRIQAKIVQAKMVQAGEPVTQLSKRRSGTDFFYTPSDGDFFASSNDFTGDGIADYVTVFFFGKEPGVFWFLSFGTNGLGQNMKIGFYDKAERAPFASPGHPGLDVSGLGSGCNTIRGQFTVLQAEFDSSVGSTVLHFAAEFEQHCEGGPRGDTGSIYFNYTPTSSLTLDPASVGGGQTAQGAVHLLEPAPFGGAVVNLTSGDTTVATVAPTINIPQGATTATFPVVTNIVKSPPSVVILATYGGVASAATLGVVSPIPSITELVMHSDPGDYIGGGSDYLFRKEDGDFIARAHFLINQGVNGATFFFNNDSHFWFMDFSVRNLGILLTPGVYENAQRYPFEQAGHPGLDVFGDGRGCNMLTGKFTIIEVTLDHSFSPPDILTFAAEFEQHCEGATPALRGTIYYNYTPPQPFNTCLKDDSSGVLLQIETSTGAYQFSNCAGVTISGTGSITERGNVVTLQHYNGDRRVTATFDRGTRIGRASIQSLSLGRTFGIIDRNISNNSCTCSQQ